MIFKVDSTIFDNFPDLRIGIVVGRGLSNGPINDELDSLFERQIDFVKNNISTESLLEQTNIKVWREVYNTLGIKASKYKPTAESFLRRILKDNPIPKISKIVNAYLLAELHTLLPIGGYDLDKISGDISLLFAKGGEQFVDIVGNVETIGINEIVYQDNQNVLTKYWNYRDSDVTKITDSTKQMALFTEAPSKEISTDCLNSTLEYIIEYTSLLCGGEYETIIVDKNNSKVNII